MQQFEHSGRWWTYTVCVVVSRLKFSLGRFEIWVNPEVLEMHLIQEHMLNLHDLSI